jgi:hypothetical protein
MVSSSCLCFVRLLLLTLLLAPYTYADPIAERDREAAALEKRGDFPALQRAAALRAALGQRAKWIADVERAVRLAPQTSDAAALVFDLALVSPPHLRIYADRFATLGGPERAVIVFAMIGEQLWTASCRLARQPGIDGLCVRVDRAAPTACVQRERWTVMPRDERANNAVAALDVAVAMFDQAPIARADVRAAYANAKRILADRALERSISEKLPKTNFKTPGASKRSTVRFNTWIAGRMKSGGAVAQQYEAILALKEPHATIASMLRLGQQSRALASELLTAPMPHRLDTGEFGHESRAAYCEQMREVTEPVGARADEAFAACAAKARELGVDDAWAEACRRALEQTSPEDFPPLRERVARPGVSR